MSELVAVISHEVLRETVKVVAVKDDLSAVDACLSSHELPGHYNLIGCLRVDDGESFINQLSNQRSQDTLGDGWFRIPCSEAMATCAALASSMDQERMPSEQPGSQRVSSDKARVVRAMKKSEAASKEPLKKQVKSSTKDSVTSLPTARTPRMNPKQKSLYDIGLKAGDVLHLLKRPDVKCKVANEYEVKYEGKNMSVSRAARLAKNVPNAKGISGFQAWQHKGTKLIDLPKKANGMGG